MKHFSAKPAVKSVSPEATVTRSNLPPNLPAEKTKESRNKANTIRNAAKAERYLMEVEKAHGFARSWGLRERLEQGQVSLAELMRG